jgi:hypothetical protein
MRCNDDVRLYIAHRDVRLHATLAEELSHRSPLPASDSVSRRLSLLARVAYQVNSTHFAYTLQVLCAPERWARRHVQVVRVRQGGCVRSCPSRTTLHVEQVYSKVGTWLLVTLLRERSGKTACEICDAGDAQRAGLARSVPTPGLGPRLWPAQI